jgi:hypothetical protein
MLHSSLSHCNCSLLLPFIPPYLTSIIFYCAIGVEAGALSKAIDQADVRVCPYLFGLETTDLKPLLVILTERRQIVQTR